MDRDAAEKTARNIWEDLPEQGRVLEDFEGEARRSGGGSGPPEKGRDSGIRR